MPPIAAWHEQWADIDQATDPDYFVRFLDETRTPTLELARQQPRQFFAYLDVELGHHILDAGCGTGEVARLLAELVGPTGHVVGLDFSRTLIDEARRRAEGLDLPLVYQVGDAQALPFPTATFDRSQGVTLLQHVPHPRRALAELIRVTKPRGLIAVGDQDWGSLIIDSEDLATTRKLETFISDSIRHGRIGRQLPRLFREAGLEDIRATAYIISLPDLATTSYLGLRTAVERALAAGVVSEAEAGPWLADLIRRGQAGQFFAIVTNFSVTGRKPTP